MPHLRSLTETLGRLLILLIFVMLHPLIHQLSRFGSRARLLDFLQGLQSIGIPLLRSLANPLLRLCRILLHSETFFITQSQIVHRLRIPHLSSNAETFDGIMVFLIIKKSLTLADKVICL